MVNCTSSLFCEAKVVDHRIDKSPKKEYNTQVRLALFLFHKQCEGGKMGNLNPREIIFVADLKKAGIIRSINPEEIAGITKNGGVGIFCGDGDIDARQFHRKMITNRPHKISIFGGVLALAKNYPGYEEHFATALINNILAGMGAKDTRTIFLCPHFPCGMASAHGLSIENVIDLSKEVHLDIVQRGMFNGERVHSFFHIKRSGEKEDIQETYLFHPELL